MKNKKLIGSLLVIVMLITMLSATVFAVGPGSIEVTNTTSGVSISDNTYYAYKIFDVTYDAGKTAYSYTVDSDFTAFFTADKITGFVDAYSYVHSLTGADNITAFAEDVSEYITPAITPTITADGSATVETGFETCTISNLELGYYLVNGTVTTTPGGETITSLCMLDTTSPTAIVHPKLDVPTVEKKVYEDSVDAWGDVADYTIGQSVPFRVTSSVPSMNGFSSYQFIVHDTMSAGLTFNNNVIVTIGGVPQVLNTDYTVTTSGQTFHIAFQSSFLTKTPNAPIVITYSAILNNSAVLFTDENPNDNPNTVNLQYSSNPHNTTATATTPNDTVLVDTYKVDIIKYTGTWSSPTYLADAHFSLKRTNETSASAIQFVYATGGYRVATAAEIDDTSVTKTFDLVSAAATGKIVVKGIDEGTYYLFETTAPAGYNKLDAAVAITLTRDFNNGGSFETATDVVKMKTNGTENASINVQNNTGVELPSTGGMGTTIFTVIGLLLMTSVVVVFITRKKLNSRKK